MLVKLNVGGTKYETSLSTLTNVDGESMLARMVQQEHEIRLIKSGQELFIDRNGALFEYVLEYLRNPKSVWLPRDMDTLFRLKKEAEFFLLEGLKQNIDKATKTFPYMPRDFVKFRWSFIQTFLKPLSDTYAILTGSQISVFGFSVVGDRYAEWFQNTRFRTDHLVEWRGQVIEAEQDAIVIRFRVFFGDYLHSDKFDLDLKVPVDAVEKVAA